MTDPSAPPGPPRTSTSKSRPSPATTALRAWCLSALELLRAWLAFLAQIGPAMGRRKASAPRPWQLRIGRSERPVVMKESEVNRLLQRHRDLQDMQKIAAMAARFRMPESDFFADPQQVERLIRRFLEESPPWLFVARTLSGEEPGTDSNQPELVWREQEVREMQDVTLFLPDETWRDQPLASLTMRPARHLEEVWQARLLDQVLPPELLIDRCLRGEILIPVRHDRKQRLEFLSEERRMEVTLRKRVPIPIDSEGGEGRGGQLLYILLDHSASMRGKSATLAMAVIAATLRANMGRRDTRYLFRRYAEELEPRRVERPIQARSLQEKDLLLDTILATNFNGAATHVNDALNVAITDVENLRREEHLEASILLVTDGRAEMLESTGLRLRETGVKLHTIMVVPERNPSMERFSESFTALSIPLDLRLNKGQVDRSQEDPATGLTVPARPRRAFHI